MDILSGEATLSKLILPFLKKRVDSKRKEFAPHVSKFFPLREEPFQKRLGIQESKQFVTKVVKDGSSSSKCIQTP